MNLSAEDSRFKDVTDQAESILRDVRAQPAHVRPWLRGIECEAERVYLEIRQLQERTATAFIACLLSDAERGQ